MEPRKVGEIVRRIKARFDQDPHGWRVFSGTDRRGNMDIFVQQAPRIWQIKAKPIDPVRSIALGAPARRLDDEINANIGEGPRPDDLLRFFRMMVPTSKEEGVVATGVEQFSQDRTSEIKRCLAERAPDQEERLEREVEREFEKQFFSRRNMFS